MRGFDRQAFFPPEPNVRAKDDPARTSGSIRSERARAAAGSVLQGERLGFEGRRQAKGVMAIIGIQLSCETNKKGQRYA